MNEPFPGGPGGGYQPPPSGRRPPNQANQPNNWPNNDVWQRPQRGLERGPVPREVPDERGPGANPRYGSHRRPELNLTTVDQLTVVQEPGVQDPEGRTATRRPAFTVNRALLIKHWALIAGVVFFLVDTILMVEGFAGSVGNASRILVIFIWLISLVAVALLWLRGSSRFSFQNPFVRVESKARHR